MKSSFYVFIGGGLGSVARFIITKLMGMVQTPFPFGTLSVNVLSCLVLGFLVNISIEKNTIPAHINLLLITGFCGGFSTYSTFTHETLELIKTEHVLLGLGNIVINFLLCITGLYMGLWISKLII